VIATLLIRALQQIASTSQFIEPNGSVGGLKWPEPMAISRSNRTVRSQLLLMHVSAPFRSSFMAAGITAASGPTGRRTGRQEEHGPGGQAKMTDIAAAPAGTAARREETGAGQDPQKRRQILAGARKVFLKHGFDAASMNDIARVAGVSKGTLYVYFESKERLFTALMHDERSQQDIHADPDDHDVEAVLTRLGRDFVTFLSSPHVIRAKRTIMAIIERMPELAADFYRDGPVLCIADLTTYLEAQVKAGVLDIDDCGLAAHQFIDLTQAGIIKPLLYGTEARVSAERIDRTVRSAVRVFLAAYRPKP
jgi:AcrR family transcriptional regulator